MRSKPFFFNIMALLLLALGFSFPLQIYLLSTQTANEFQDLPSNLTLINYLCMIVFIAMSFFTYTTNRAALFFIPVGLGLVVYNNYMISSYGNDFSFVQATMASIVFGTISFFYLQPKILKCLTDPKYRWWAAKPRFLKSIPIKIFHNGEIIRTSTFDISETGIFVKQDSGLLVNTVKIGEVVSVHLGLGEHEVAIKAKLIRKSIPQGVYPAGAGFQFAPLQSNKDIYRKLSEYIQDMSIKNGLPRE